jgi:hypothetical protein
VAALSRVHSFQPANRADNDVTMSFHKMFETVLRDHLRDNLIHRSCFNNAAGINSNGKMVFERLERTVYVAILSLTAAVIKSFKKEK